MSLCILLRTPDGAALMAADSAVSTVYEGVPYRVQNEEDHEKVITHLGHLIFCSGNLERCRVLRQYIRSLKEMDYEAISQTAKQIWGDEAGDDSTGILICAPDNSLVGMLSAQGFAVTELPWNQNGLDIDTLGFRMQDAYQVAREAAKTAEDWRDTVLKTYSAVSCEEVGGALHVFSRKASEEIRCMTVPIQERPVRRGVFVALSKEVYALHAIVQAAQFLDKNGKDMFTNEGKIAGEYLDLRGVNIVNAAGETMITIDETGMHFKAGYSPVKYQFSSTSENGPWHDTMTKNDKYRRDSVDGGTTWGAGYQFVGVDGQNGFNGSDADVTRSNILRAMLKNEPEDGLYVVDINGKQCLGINATAIKTGVLDSIRVSSCDIFGGRFGDQTDNGNPNAWLEMGMIGGGYGMKLWHKLYRTAPVFTVWDNGSGYTRVSLKNREVLFQDPSHVNKPQGVWDFGEATEVKGVPVRFG